MAQTPSRYGVNLHRVRHASESGDLEKIKYLGNAIESYSPVLFREGRLDFVHQSLGTTREADTVQQQWNTNLT